MHVAYNHLQHDVHMMFSVNKNGMASAKDGFSQSSGMKCNNQQHQTLSPDEIKCYSTSFGFTEEQIKQLLEAFSVFDKDNDMMISQLELQNILTSLGQRPSRHELETLIRGVDPGRRGAISFEKFLVLMARRVSDNQEDDLKEVFEVFDINGDGRITADELHEILFRLGEETSREEVSEMIKEADINNDGAVDYKEFISILSAR